MTPGDPLDLFRDLFRPVSTERERSPFIELVRELLSPAELAVTLATLGLALLLVLIVAATLYSTFFGIPIQ